LSRECRCEPFNDCVHVSERRWVASEAPFRELAEGDLMVDQQEKHWRVRVWSGTTKLFVTIEGS